MSGFELEHRGVSDKFERNQQAFKSSKDDSNRALLESLKRSANIAQDLASLYSERPYVYARVMKQLSGVLGAARVRRLHTTVQDNARRMAEVQRAEAEKTAKKSLHKKSVGASQGSVFSRQTTGNASVTDAGKDYNIQFLGVSTKVKVSSDNGTHAIECSEWNIPYLKSLRGSATIKNADLSEIKLDATLEAKHLKSTQVHFKLKKMNGRFEPTGSFSTAVEIPGLDDLNVAFKCTKAGETTKLEGRFATDATLFKSVKVGASGKVDLNQGNTSVEGTLSAKGMASSNAGVAQKGWLRAIRKLIVPQKAAASTGTNLNMRGTVNLSVTDGTFDAVSGEITATGFGFVADPSSSVTLSVRHTGEDFEAKMSQCALKPYTVPGTQATLSMTIQEASYSSANQFSAKAHVDAKLLEAVTAEGDVEFANNKLQAATLTVHADNFSIPAKKASGGAQSGAENAKGGASILGGSLTGTLGIVDGAFEKANVTGNIHLTVAQKTIGVNLDTIDIDAQGAVKGSVSLEQPFALGCATLMSCQADFDSAAENMLTRLDGTVKIDHPNLKSEEPGLSFGYAGGELQASGAVKVLQKDGAEIATSQLTMNLSAETLSATCDINLDNDFQIPDAQSKFKILKGATAKVEIVDNVVQPLKFSGDYKYGEGRDGGQADTKSAGAGGFAFSGSVQDGVYDLNTGAFDGTVSAQLDSDVSISGGCAKLTLPTSYYGAENKMTVTFANSKPTTATGELTGKSNLELKKGKNGNLAAYMTAKVECFDFEKGAFTGQVMAKLTENFELYKGEDGTLIVLQGRRESGLNLTVAANNITDMDLDIAAKVSVPNHRVTQRKVVFDADFKNVKVDMDTLAILNANVSATLDGDIEINAHEDQTHVTVKNQSAMRLDIENGMLSTFTLDAAYEGRTNALKTAEAIAFKGSPGLLVKKNGDADYDIKGDVDIETTKNCTLDAIEGVDKIVLEKQSKFCFSFSNERLTKVSGTFKLDYEHTATDHLPKGFGAKLVGKNLTYTISGDQPSFDGTVSLTPSGNIPLQAASAGGGAYAEFTLLKKGTKMEAVIKKSKLKKLTGDATFKARAGLQGAESGSEICVENGEANCNFDVETGEMENLKLHGDASLNAIVKGGRIEVKSDNITADAEFDKDGLASCGFSGKAAINVKLGDDKTLCTELDGTLNYGREENFNGTVSLRCVNETLLGDFSHNNKTFEYGLGQAKGPAAAIGATIIAGEVNRIDGSIGLFLRQTGEDDLGLLKLNGDVDFSYDVLSGTLDRASGTVSIEEKTLFKSGGENQETLVLKPSEATITFENNQFKGINGSVNLALADKDGDYLNFATKGDFDCLGENKFTGSVSASFVRDKELGKPTSEGYQFVMATGGGFECDIEENQIGALSGDFNFKVKEGENDLFAGAVHGDYKPASEEGTESLLNATGEISLQRDMNIDKEGKFKLGKGSKGSATIVNNALQQIHGELVVIIDGPNTANGKSGAQLKVTAAGTVDLAKGEVTDFSGQAELVGGPFQLTDNLSITKLAAEVTITNNQLNKICGAAGIKYDNNGFLVTGDANLEWEKASQGGEDKIGFNGELSITAFEGKLSGTVGVDYKSYENGGAPKINGKLFFKITDWLGGEIGVKFENGWDDPVVFGTMRVTDVELMAARTLFNKSKDLGYSQHIQAGYVPLELGIGVGFGLSLAMQAIKFNASIEIGDYHVKSPKGIPDFTTKLTCSTGLDLTASIKPYLSLGVGIACFQGGLKIKGGANFKAAATADIGGTLKGGEQGLSGDFGLGVAVTGSFSVDVTPSFFANVFGANFEKDIHTWTFDLGEIFKFTWGKRVVWDKSGTHLEDGGPATPMAPEKSTTATENKSGDVGPAYKKADKGTKKEGAPQLEDSQKLGQNVGGKSPDSAEGLGDMGRKIELAKKVAAAIGSIGDAVGLISGVVSSLSFGPLGPVVFIALKIITGELSIDKIKTAFNNIKNGIAAIKELIGDPDALLQKILPESIYKIYKFMRTATLETVKNKVLETLKEKFKSYGSPLNELLQPVLKFIGGRFDYVARILELFKSGSTSGIIKGILKILGFSLSSIVELINMGREMIAIFKELVRANVKNGNIYIKYRSRWGFDQYWWKFCIPGLVNWSGTTENQNVVQQGVTAGICTGLLALFKDCGLKKVKK